MLRVAKSHHVTALILKLSELTVQPHRNAEPVKVHALVCCVDSFGIPIIRARGLKKLILEGTVWTLIPYPFHNTLNPIDGFQSKIYSEKILASP